MPHIEVGSIGKDGITLEVVRQEVGFTSRGIDAFCEHLKVICRDGARVRYCYVGVDVINARLRPPWQAKGDGHDLSDTDGDDDAGYGEARGDKSQG